MEESSKRMEKEMVGAGAYVCIRPGGDITNHFSSCEGDARVYSRF